MTATLANFRYLGITDACVECEKCGKVDLRSTVVLAPLDAEGNDDGDPVYYGSTCAARALCVPGGGREVLRSARNAHFATHRAAQDARAMLAHYGLPESGDPGQDALRAAMCSYIRQHPNIARRVEETGIGVRDMVLDMLARKRAALADAATLGIDVDSRPTW